MKKIFTELGHDVKDVSLSNHTWVFNRPKNSMSILELLNFLKIKHNVNYKFDECRIGDQKIYISNIGKIKHDINWEPKINIVDGFEKLHKWVIKNEKKFKTLNLIK
jgi:CDP-paratose 2-epimerase